MEHVVRCMAEFGNHTDASPWNEVLSIKRAVSEASDYGGWACLFGDCSWTAHDA